MSRNQTNNEELTILSRGDWPRLEVLDLSFTQITKNSFSNFLLNANWPNFKEIILPQSFNEIERNLALSFIKKDLSQAERLELNNSKVTLAEIESVLSRNKCKCPQLKYLDLSNNNISHGGKISFLAFVECPLLEELHLENTKIESEGFKIITTQSKWPNLKHLNVSNNEIFDEGISTLAFVEWPLLEELHVKNAKITSRAIEIIVNDLKVSNLKRIDISENAIPEEGLKMLASASRKWPLLVCLNWKEAELSMKRQDSRE